MKVRGYSFIIGLFSTLYKSTPDRQDPNRCLWIMKEVMKMVKCYNENQLEEL
jgi:hypothetical protein